MLSFMTSLVIGPFPPHAPFLDRGIDSLTVRFRLHNTQDNHMHTTQQLALTLRMLSGLHETLHHSVTQYLLPSKDKFVSNGEYIYPTLLLLLPMALRVLLIVLMKDGDNAVLRCWREVTTLATVCWGGVSLPLWLLMGEDHIDHSNTIYSVLYLVALLLLYYVMVVRSSPSSHTLHDTAESVQCFAALLSVYLHVPLALAHVSLAIPSALLWSPLLAFPAYYKKRSQQSLGFLTRGWCLLLWAITWPPTGLAAVFGGRYTMYLTWVYTPLHLMFATLCLLLCSS